MSAINEHVLPNGMTLLCLQQPHLHSISFGLHLKGGPLYENRQNQGVCHLLEHLCFRGLGGLSHDELQERFNRFGMDMDGATYREAMVFTLGARPRFFDDMVDLFLRFFAGTPWTQEQIDKEKQVVLRQIEQEDPDFDDQIDLRYRKTAQGAYPCMGTAASIEKMSAATIRRWQRLIFQPQNACLCITGNFSDGMEQAAVEAFSELVNTTDEPPFLMQAPEGFCMRDENSDIIRPEEDGQAKVRLHFDVDNDLVFPLVGDVLSCITGGNCDSILFQELRETEALVAEIDASMDELGIYRRLVIDYDVRQEYLVESLEKVFALLVRLRTYVRPSRLEHTRTQFTENNLFELDSSLRMNDRLGWAWISEDVARADLDAQTAMYEDLTAEDLLNAAQAVFRPENLVIAIQRDPARTPRNLKPLLRRLRAMLA